jgi:hypothetical protein
VFRKEGWKGLGVNAWRKIRRKRLEKKGRVKMSGLRVNFIRRLMCAELSTSIWEYWRSLDAEVAFR